MLNLCLRNQLINVYDAQYTFFQYGEDSFMEEQKMGSRNIFSIRFEKLSGSICFLVFFIIILIGYFNYIQLYPIKMGWSNLLVEMERIKMIHSVE